MRRLNRFFRKWWPLVVALAGASILVAMGVLINTAIDDRAQLREQRDLLSKQSKQLASIIERGEVAEEGAENRLNKALIEVEEVLIDHFARHDANVAEKLNEMLHRIEVLLGRPAGTQPEPVTAEPVAPAPRHEPTVTSLAPSPAPKPSPPPPATTTPDQKSCAKHPSGPRC